MKLFNLLTPLLLSISTLGYIDLDVDHSAFVQNADLEDYVKAHLAVANKVYTERDSSYLLFYVLDLDRNGFLDGHELRANIHSMQNEKKVKGEDIDIMSLEKLNEYVDTVLKEDDIDGDGRISIDEFMASQIYHHQVDKENLEEMPSSST